MKGARATFGRLAAGLVALLLAGPAAAQDARTPDAALDAMLGAIVQDAANACAPPYNDRLAQVLCKGEITIGLRDFYPLFSERTDKSDDEVSRAGYEVDLASAIAARLGVRDEHVRVNAATRIPSLAEGQADLVIATMGHNTQRDTQVRFIRPHYYRSETVFIGPKSLPIEDWNDISGRAVCVTVGNLSNAQIAARGARIMLYDEAGVLPLRLRDKNCTLAAQDDSFFAKHFADPDFADAFSIKFGFSQVPWGMAVARDGSADLARAVDLVLQIFHRDGVLLRIAERHGIRTTFLEEQQKVWRTPACNIAHSEARDACLLPPLHAALEPTPFADDVTQFEKWASATVGFDISLPMLKTEAAWSIFQKGMANTLILVVGALVATFVFALILGAAMASNSFLIRWPARFVTIVVQSSPIVLTLVIAAAFAHALFPYSSAVAMGAAILALGLTNGGNAGQALSEAIATTRQEAGGPGAHFLHALGRSATQIANFLINAAKGTPIAAFIGAPELLSTLTDITSFSTKRATTYLILLIFYTVVVAVVVWLCFRLRAYLERRQVA